MRSKFGHEKVESRIPVADWARWSYVLERVKGAASLLDVGTAHGTFLNSLACARAAEELTGIDIRNYSLYAELYPGFKRIEADVADMPFGDGAFDTVTCMEVVEHLPDEKLEQALSALRRVSNRRLIVSVPFCEGEPIYKGHFQRFTVDRIEALFPNASYTLLMKERKGATPWLLIEEPGD